MHKISFSNCTCIILCICIIGDVTILVIIVRHMQLQVFIEDQKWMMTEDLVLLNFIFLKWSSFDVTEGIFRLDIWIWECANCDRVQILTKYNSHILWAVIYPDLQLLSVNPHYSHAELLLMKSKFYTKWNSVQVWKWTTREIIQNPWLFYNHWNDAHSQGSSPSLNTMSKLHQFVAESEV